MPCNKHSCLDCKFLGVDERLSSCKECFYDPGMCHFQPIEAITQVDIYVPMPPKKRYRIKARVKSIKRAKLPNYCGDLTK